MLVKELYQMRSICLETELVWDQGRKMLKCRREHTRFWELVRQKILASKQPVQRWRTECFFKVDSVRERSLIFVVILENVWEEVVILGTW